MEPISQVLARLNADNNAALAKEEIEKKQRAKKMQKIIFALVALFEGMTESEIQHIVSVAKTLDDEEEYLADRILRARVSRKVRDIFCF